MRALMVPFPSFPLAKKRASDTLSAGQWRFIEWGNDANCFLSNALPNWKAQIVASSLVSRRGGPLKRPRADAADRIRKLATQGHRWLGIAARFDIDPKTLRNWREEFPELQTAYEEGRESERWTLHSLLSQQARNGNTTAAIFLLKAAHGYREGDQSDQGGRVAIQINLPGPMTLDQFRALGTPQTTKGNDHD